MILSLILTGIGCAKCEEPDPKLNTKEQLDACVVYIVENEKATGGEISIQLDSLGHWCNLSRSVSGLAIDTNLPCP